MQQAGLSECNQQRMGQNGCGQSATLLGLALAAQCAPCKHKFNVSDLGRFLLQGAFLASLQLRFCFNEGC